MPSKNLYNQCAQKHKSRTTKSPLMQDWVFSLGFRLLISYFFYLSSQFHIRVNKFCDFMKCRDNLLWKIKTVPRTFNDILLPKLFWPTLRKIVLVIEKNFEIISTINSNSERSEKFWLTECFFNLLFLISNKLEQLEVKLEKKIGFRNTQEKLEKVHFLSHLV